MMAFLRGKAIGILNSSKAFILARSGWHTKSGIP